MSETQNVIINNLKMETKRISEKEIEGMPVLATGYKMFKNDWTLNGINYITVPSKINYITVPSKINYITVQSKINSDCTYNCSKSDTCVNGSKLRGVCKIKLNEKNCKSYEEILGYSITFDF